MPQLILGIETSCDETAAAVVADGHDVRSNVVHSQIALHQRFGGVVPEVASRSHTERILPIVEQALADAGVTPQDLTAIAVTSRPGMVGCLLVGMAAAKALAWRFDRPLIGVDHVQAHVHTGLLAEPDMPLPALSLVASGGHTALYLLTTPGRSERLGTTRDDAAGEALDKGAALLGLEYPGGPSIEKAAAGGDAKAFDFPRTLLTRESLDFSFSGLKTSLLYTLQPQGAPAPDGPPTGQRLADLAASYQEAVVDVLVQKLRRAAAQHDVRSLCIGGGVAKNLRLRERLAGDARLNELRLVLPPLSLRMVEDQLELLRPAPGRRSVGTVRRPQRHPGDRARDGYVAAVAAATAWSATAWPVTPGRTAVSYLVRVHPAVAEQFDN